MSPHDLPALTQANGTAIRAAIATAFNVRADDLQLLPDETFMSESEPGKVCFMALHEQGFFGAQSIVQGDGSLGPISAVRM